MYKVDMGHDIIRIVHQGAQSPISRPFFGQKQYFRAISGFEIDINFTVIVDVVVIVVTQGKQSQLKSFWG